jgi:Cysteine rich repeat
LTNRFSFLFAAALAPLALWGGIAELRAAPTEAQQQAIRSSCQSDYRSYCASVPTGGSAALQCLEKNVASLSSACQQAVKAASGGGGSSSTTGESGAATTTAPATATAPATTTAPAADSGSSAAAGQAVIVLKPGQEIALMREACGADYRAHCDGVRIIGGGALSCLVSHASSLSPSCKTVLGKLGQKF